MRKCTSEKFHREKFITEERVPTGVIQHAFFEFIIFLVLKTKANTEERKEKGEKELKPVQLVYLLHFVRL